MPFRSSGAGLALGTLLLAFTTLLIPRPAAAVTHNVSVRDFQFVPATLEIAPGDVVRWNWVNGFHTTTSGTAGTPNGLWNAPIDNGNTFFQRTFNSAGSFPYFCSFHFGVMSGTITVTQPNNPPVVTNPGTQNGTELVFFTVTVTATDADGGVLTMSDLGTTPSWATFVDNGNNSCTISGTPNAAQAATYPVSVRASDGIANDTENFNIVIAEAPPVVVRLEGTGFQPATATIQVGQSIQWQKIAGGNHSTTSGTGGVPNGLWDAPLTNGSPTFTFAFNTPGSFPYFCTPHPVGETGTIVVEPLPTCTVSGPDPVCSGNTGLIYTSSVNPATGTLLYSWSISGNGSIIGSTTGTSVNVTAGSAGSYTLTLNGTRNGVIFQCQKVVTVNASPGCIISGPAAVLESSTGTAFTTSVSPGGGTLTYAWSILGNGTLSGPTTGSSVLVNAGAPGSFTLSQNVTRNGCPTLCQHVVTVNAAGVAATVLVESDFFNPVDVTIAVGQQVKWKWVSGIHTTTSGYSSDPTHNPGALWDVPITEDDSTFIYQFDDPGYYPYFCVIHEGMGMRGSVRVGAVTGAEDGKIARPRLAPSPNPFQDKVLLVIELPQDERVVVDIYDLSGRKVLDLMTVDLPAGSNRVYWMGWDDRHQPVVPGVYFARMETGSGQVTVQKLFKMR